MSLCTSRRSESPMAIFWWIGTEMKKVNPQQAIKADKPNKLGRFGFWNTVKNHPSNCADKRGIKTKETLKV